MVVLTIEVLLLGTALLFLLTRRRTAIREVGRLVEHGGLPAEPELIEAAQGWYMRRQVVLLIGMVAGALLGGAVVLILRPGGDFRLASEFDIRLLTGMIAVTAAVGGLASLVHSYRTVRASRFDGPRTATLRPRQLRDYLSPVEIAIQYGALLLPAVAAVMGIVILRSSDHPGRGWILIGSGIAAAPLWGLGILLQRKALEVNQPSRGAAELRWQEALRATTLRDIASSGLTVCWLLGAAIPMSFQWPADAPAYFSGLAGVLFLISLGLLCLSTIVGRSGSALRRVERVVG
ncbi:hypothetical protein AB0E69_10155 [Kribbella sp. NPDC026611]|uniref:hypothetical protein n=1 Tax=Kribbella sp. NPDC026611 TaxID=3154911 RepID=UPI0033DE9DE6